MIKGFLKNISKCLNFKQKEKPLPEVFLLPLLLSLYYHNLVMTPVYLLISYLIDTWASQTFRSRKCVRILFWIIFAILISTVMPILAPLHALLTSVLSPTIVLSVILLMGLSLFIFRPRGALSAEDRLPLKTLFKRLLESLSLALLGREEMQTSNIRRISIERPRPQFHILIFILHLLSPQAPPVPNHI
jgi:hypothetical protein